MSAQHTPGPSQRVEPRSILGNGSAEFEVVTHDNFGDLKSRTNVRTKSDWPWIDISIEEFTGITRRAKFTSVRLEEAAARELYAALAAKFGSPS